MPKMKSHSGAKKRFRITGKGRVKSGASHRSHFMRRRSQNMKRTARQGLILFKTDGENIIKFFLPNG